MRINIIANNKAKNDNKSIDNMEKDIDKTEKNIYNPESGNFYTMFLKKVIINTKGS